MRSGIEIVSTRGGGSCVGWGRGVLVFSQAVTGTGDPSGFWCIDEAGNPQSGNNAMQADAANLRVRDLQGNGSISIIRTRPWSTPYPPMCVEVIADAYGQHARAYYRPVPGRSTGHLKVIRSALRLLVRMYGHTLVAKFGPVALTTVRDAMAKPKTIKGWRRIEDPGTGKKIRRQVEVERPGWSWKFCNAQLVRLKAVFRWAASRELIPASIVMALDTVDGLRKGKCEARETHPVIHQAGLRC